MKNILSIFLLPVVVFFCSSCQTNTNTKSENINDHPAWIMQGSIYEVNVRQYTEEGTLLAFAKHLDRLKEMGVQTVWYYGGRQDT